MSETILDPQVIVDFWREAGPEKWFEKDEAFDETIRQRFGDLYACLLYTSPSPRDS